MKKNKILRPVALVAVGVFLGRAAQADTTLDFDSTAAAAGQVNNANLPPGITNFGNFVTATTPGITVSGGFGTPNIGLNWGGIPSPDTRWEYYNDGGYRWSAVQLQGSFVGSTEKITFVPNNPAASVVVKSFNFHPYYYFTGTAPMGELESAERFTYDVSVVAGSTVLFGPTNVTFRTDASKAHPVNINYTGAPGQTLKLRISRVTDTLGVDEEAGGQFDIAVDDIKFAQLPESVLPAGPQVVSVTPADDTTGLAAASSPPYLASITNGATTLVAGSIQLKLDGILVSPSPTISSSGGLTNVSYPGAASLLTSGSHVYTLTYEDNLGGSYTNEVAFSTIYATLPATYALPPGAGVTRGFTYRTVSASTEATNLAYTIARAKAQLNGTLINPATSLPYTNSATLGTNADGSFNIDTVLNFLDTGTAGNFPDDETFPGLDPGPDPFDWFSTEALLHLDLPAGYYRFGVNSDDGFEASAVPPQGVPGSPIVLGLFDGGRGAGDPDILFDVLVQTSGIYPFRVIHFEGNQSASCEFFSVTNVATTNKVLVNDLADSNAVKSYRVLKPRITSIVPSGPNVVVDWAYGTPPFQVQFRTNITDTWNNTGSTTMNRTANVLIQPDTGFIRVFGQ